MRAVQLLWCFKCNKEQLEPVWPPSASAEGVAALVLGPDADVPMHRTHEHTSTHARAGPMYAITHTCTHILAFSSAQEASRRHWAQWCTANAHLEL